jgi:hypothetical protein
MALTGNTVEFMVLRLYIQDGRIYSSLYEKAVNHHSCTSLPIHLTLPGSRSVLFTASSSASLLFPPMTMMSWPSSVSPFSTSIAEAMPPPRSYPSTMTLSSARKTTLDPTPTPKWTAVQYCLSSTSTPKTRRRPNSNGLGRRNYRRPPEVPLLHNSSVATPKWPSASTG